MDFALLFENLLAPPILFFGLGLLAVFVRSDLEIPQPIPKFLALYLLLAIGFRGGVELRHGGAGPEVLRALGAAILMSVVVPCYAFLALRRRLDAYNAAAIAATYGSVSAVTFITATSFLARMGVDVGGHMIAAMALMESPAIVAGVLFVRLSTGGEGGGISWRALLHDSFFNGTVFLLLGSLVVGLLSTDAGAAAMKPFTEDLFRGVLAFFLLDMGILAARRFADFRAGSGYLVAAALLLPLVNAAVALGVARAASLGAADAFMLVVLAASASYIAVPAAMRLVVPQANPSLFVPMSLAVTFPFNITVGLPLYHAAVRVLWS